MPMIGTLSLIKLFLVCAWLQPAPERGQPKPATDRPLVHGVRAELRADVTILTVGSPVYVEFLLRNLTGEAMTFTVPGALQAEPRPEYGMGLPLEHVFSSINYRGLEISSEENPQMGHRVTRKPQFPVPSIILAPYGSVGLRFDVARFYPGLHQAGTYVLTWKPYHGAMEARPLTLKVVRNQQAVIETEYGKMAMRLLYDKAPRHVENFIELVQKRFYNGKTFHSIFPNQFILGGCPIGDGTGKREDGLTLEPEFNDTPFDVGTVAMALLDSEIHSASCQFFICFSRQPAWDGRYTAFGRIEGPESLETLRKLGQVATDTEYRPEKQLKIKRITITSAPFVPKRF